MGGISSKLERHIEFGDEYAAMKIINKNKEIIMDKFDPNLPFSEFGNSGLHLAAKHAMLTLLRIMLFEMKGDPNRVNHFNQNCLHIVCQMDVSMKEKCDATLWESMIERRVKCAFLILSWKKEDIGIDLCALDRAGNSALHYSAQSGLLQITEVFEGCSLYVTNNSGDTACDMAYNHHNDDIARYLEFKMVFSDECSASSLHQWLSECTINETYSGLELSELKEAKDLLLNSTAQCLNISISAAESLLRFFEWSKETLLKEWENNNRECCTKAGIDFDLSTESNHDQVKVGIEKEIGKMNHLKVEEKENDSLKEPIESESSIYNPICGICTNQIYKSKLVVSIPCKHEFCLDCWKSYVEMKINEQDILMIECPQYKCFQFVPCELITKVTSTNIAERFLKLDIEAYVKNNANIQWCSAPGCERAVYFPDTTDTPVTYPNIPSLPPISHAVDCGSGHYFCWECQREAHAPCHCKLWESWMIKIDEVPDDFKDTNSRTEDAANCLWLIRNSKSCPQCKAHIQKLEGCNHMRCSKCKYDFCWICLEAWKKHNSATGGYFRCNRSEAAQRASQNVQLIKKCAEAKQCELQELKKFVHFYTKYKMNDAAYKTELQLVEKSKQKQIELTEYALQSTENLIHSLPSQIEINNFLLDATLEVLKSRRILIGSAVYGFYLDDSGYNNAIYEFMEQDLSSKCNLLSEILMTDRLKASQCKIIELTQKLKQKRLEFLHSVSSGIIIPPETPPSFRKRKALHARQRRRIPGVQGLDLIESDINSEEDEDLKKAIIASISQLDPTNPWVCDSNGLHANLTAIYDWPDDYDDDDLQINMSYDKNKQSTTYGEIHGERTIPESELIASNSHKVCLRESCTRVVVRNPRTNQMHNYCSLKCKQLDENEKNQVIDKCNDEIDSSMDIMLAIEMSKISAIEDDKNRASEIKQNQDTRLNQNYLRCESISFDGFSEQQLNELWSQQVTRDALFYFLKSSITNEEMAKNLNKNLQNNMNTDEKITPKIKL